MINWLNQAYPYRYFFKKTYLFALGLSIFIFLFLFLLNPFGLESDVTGLSFPGVCALYAINVGLIIIVAYQLFPYFFPKYFNEEHWTIGREIMLILLILSLVGLVNFFIGFLVDRQMLFSPYGLMIEFLTDIYHTVFIGIIPATIVILISYVILLQENQNKSKELETELVSQSKKTTDNHQEISIESSVKSDSIKFDKDDLIFIKAEGNYLEFYFSKNDRAEKVISRNTLVVAEKILAEFNHFIKTHRSYLVNLNYISKIDGNAQGYQLHFANVDFPIPVSRGKLKTFNERIGALRGDS